MTPRIRTTISYPGQLLVSVCSFPDHSGSLRVFQQYYFATPKTCRVSPADASNRYKGWQQLDTGGYNGVQVSCCPVKART